MSKISGEFLKFFGEAPVSKRPLHEKDISFKPDWPTPRIARQIQEYFKKQPPPNPPGEWVNEPAPAWDALTPEEIDAIIEQYYMWMFELAILWYDRMAANNITIREMMTLFWHNHFAVEVDKVFSLRPCFVRSSPPLSSF